MGTISDKTTYLNTTKTKIREKINDLGQDLDEEDTFRSYAEALEQVWDKYPKVTATDVEEANIDGTKKGRMEIDLKGNTSQVTRILPEGYTQLDYIESTGTQYIDTGFIPTLNTKISVDFKSNKVSGETFTSLFGTQKNVNNGRLYCLFGGTNNIQVNIPSSRAGFVYLHGDGTYSQTVVGNFFTSNRTNYIMDISNKIIQIENIIWDLSSFYTDFVSPDYNLFILARNTSGTADGNRSKGLLYGAKIWNNNVLVRNFIPCYRNSDNVVGMYDLATNTFYTNSGTGDFIAGNEVSIPNQDFPQDVEVVTGENTIKVEGKNLFDKESKINGYYINADGELIQGQFNVSDYIIVSGNQYITISGMTDIQQTWASKCAFYDKNKNFISSANLDSPYITHSIPNNAYYFRTTIRSANVNTLQIEYGNQTTTYEEHKEQDFPISLSSRNLFDKDHVTFITGVLDDNGINTGSTSSHYTNNFYKVIPNTNYTLSGTLVISTTHYRIYYYDENQNWISRTATQSSNLTTFQTPNNCYYIRIQVAKENNLDSGNVQLEVGSTATSYQPYYNYELCKIGDYQDYIYKNNDNWYIKKKIGKVILNGTENWLMRTTKTLTQVFLYLSDLPIKGINVFYSNYFIYQEGDLPKIAFSNVEGEIFIAVYKTLANNVNKFKTWLSEHNTSLYYILKDEQDILITDTTLINQLNNLYDAKSYDNVTNIVQKNNDLPFILDITAIGGTASLQSKTVSPTTSQQTVTPDSGYDGLSDVTVNAVTSAIDNNIQAGNIKKNVEILGVTGDYEPTPNLQTKSISITQNGSQTVAPDSGYDGFGEVNITTNVVSPYNVKAVSNDKDPGMAGSTTRFCRILYWLTEVDNLDIGNLTDIKGLFGYCLSLTTFSISDTSNVEIMSYMFQLCQSLTTVPAFNTSNVTNMQAMFTGCQSLTSVPNFDVSKVTNMTSMFQNCQSLATVPAFNTSDSLTTTNGMFQGCSSLVSVPLFNTSKVTNMSGMFNNCTNLETVPVFDTSSNTNFSNMFRYCASLTDQSLDNILQMCINAIAYTGSKSLFTVGITDTTIYPASRIQALPHYQDFINAGWTIS